MKKISFTAVLLCAVLALGGCSFNSEEALDYIYSILGIDNTDYSAETVVSLLENDSVQAQTLAERAKILCYGGINTDIICFDRFSDVSADYIDTVLNYLAGTFYSRYSADKEMMEKFSEEYPELAVNTIIPQSDYENEVYSAFGGKKKAVNKSTAAYTYLDKINAYLLTGRLELTEVTYSVYEACETEHTYRITVSFYENGESSDKYEIVFIKREDNSAYMYSVNKSNKIIVIPETAED